MVRQSGGLSCLKCVFLSQSVCVCVCVSCMHVYVCVCLGVNERERKSERKRNTERGFVYLRDNVYVCDAMRDR